MPTLGFLKKKRTKESSAGPRDLPSPTGISSQSSAPTTPTSSTGFDLLVPSVSSQSSAPRDFSQPTVNSKNTNPTAVGESPAMTQGAIYQQQNTASVHTIGSPVTGAQQQNLPYINNLIHPPQHDGAAQSIPSQTTPSNINSIPSNGIMLADASHLSQYGQAQPQIRETRGKYTLGDFDILRTLGTGSFGRVHLVQSKHNQRFYAVKVLKKQQVVKMKQVEHTNDERKMLQEVKHPFLITLWGTFQDPRNLYMVMDFVEGGELFSLLRKSQVRKSLLIHTWHYN